MGENDMNRAITGGVAMLGIILVAYAIATPGLQGLPALIGGLLFGFAWTARE